MAANLNEAQRSVVDTLRAHWRIYVFEGVVMIVLGVLAIVFPVFATLAVALDLGWLFLICGILALIVMISTGRIPGFWWALVTAILAVVVGLALLLKPAAGIVSLTAVLTAFFIVEGIFQTMAALSHRQMIPIPGAGCSRAASPISCSPRSSSPDGPAQSTGRSGCSPG